MYRGICESFPIHTRNKKGDFQHMTIYTPYTYLIGWSDLNKFYYGVRYAKNCHPDELWKSYFTSSKHVKDFRKKYGDPDIVQIRKTFDNSESSRIWESKVLRRVKAKNKKYFLNATDNISIPKTDYDYGSNFSGWNKERTGKTWEELYGIQVADDMKRRAAERMLGKKIALGCKRCNPEPYSNAAKKRWQSEEYRQKNSYKWITHIEMKQIKKVHSSDVERYINDGWIRGRKRKEIEY